MAETELGIKYPNDGNKSATILEDLKNLAESIDKAIKSNLYDDSKILKDIEVLSKEQSTQNEDISKLQKENIMLKEQIPKGQVSGQEISLSDSAKMPLIEFSVKGNSRQSTEPTLEASIEVEAIENNVKLIKSNKNLLDLGESSKNNIVINKNRVTINAPTASITANNCNLLNNKFVSNKTVCFTFIANGTISEGSNMKILFRTKSNSYKIQKIYEAKTYTNDISKLKVNFAADEVISEVYLFVSDANINMTVDIQVEVNEASDFVEHEAATYNIAIQKPFYKLISEGEYGTVYDKFVKIENKWYEQHSIQKINLSEFDWERGAVLGGTDVNTLRWNSVDAVNAKIASDKGALSNCFKNLAGQLYDTDRSCFRIERDRICVRLPKTIATNATQVKEYFKTLKEQEKSVYVIATLATPELIECTQEQTQVLEQILQDGTYKGITHYYTTNNLKATIELTYYKDLEAIVNNIQRNLLSIVGGN